MVPIGTEGDVWGCRNRLNGGIGGLWKHTYEERERDNKLRKEEE